jgi:hypothetical protein
MRESGVESRESTEWDGGTGRKRKAEMGEGDSRGGAESAEGGGGESGKLKAEVGEKSVGGDFNRRWQREQRMDAIA